MNQEPPRPFFNLLQILQLSWFPLLVEYEIQRDEDLF